MREKGGKRDRERGGGKRERETERDRERERETERKMNIWPFLLHNWHLPPRKCDAQ